MIIKKGDILNEAFSLLRISGITVEPSAEELELGLRRLESMANEFFLMNICIGYNFEDTPDINSVSGVSPGYLYSFACILAERLMPDFGKSDEGIIRASRQGISFILSSVNKVLEVPYPARHPLGSGLARFWKYRNFFPATVKEVEYSSCKVNEMYVGEVNDFMENFSSYLLNLEDISTYTLSADQGLKIISDSLTSPVIFYRIEAQQATSESGLFNLKISIETITGRKAIRQIQFKITESVEIT